MDKRVFLRTALAADALAFLTAAALNFGARIPLGVTTLAFPTPGPRAAVGEAVIGAALAAAAVTLSLSLSWVAYTLSAIGIAVGLIFTSRTRGPAWDVHLALLALAVIVLGGLIWNAERLARGHRSRATSIAGLMLVAAGTLAVASAIHFGVPVPLGFATLHDPFAGAAVPEAVLAAIMAAGAAVLLSGWEASQAIALGSAFFTLLGTLYGLSFTLRGRGAGDVAYHFTLLAMLVVIVGLLLSRRRLRQAAI